MTLSHFLGRRPISRRNAHFLYTADVNEHSASCGPSAVAELFVCKKSSPLVSWDVGRVSNGAAENLDDFKSGGAGGD